MCRSFSSNPVSKARIGAAITAYPNSVNVLKHRDIDPDRYAVKSRAVTYAMHDTLELLASESFDAVEDRFGNALYRWHHIDQHQTLRESIQPHRTRSQSLQLECVTERE